MARRLILTDNGQIELLEDSANGTNRVIWKAPASIASDITLTWPGTLPGSTQFLQVDSSGVMSFALGSSTLDSAYESGQSIVADLGDIAITGAGLVDCAGGFKSAGNLELTGASSQIILESDVNLYRDSANILKTDDGFDCTTIDITNNLRIRSISGQLILGTDGTSVSLKRGAAGLLQTDDDFKIDSATPTLQLGSDVNLFRSAADILRTNDNLTVDLDLIVTGGDITLGADVNLTRASADLLQTDDSFEMGTTSTSNPYINIRGGNAAPDASDIRFTDSVALAGRIRYIHNTNDMEFMVDGTDRFVIETNNWGFSGSGNPRFYSGSGSPESSITADPGSAYMNTAGGSGTTLYVKASGTGNTGWRAVTDAAP